MKIVRTIVWVLLLTALLVFSAFNWNPVEVKIWEGLVLETKLPALVVIAFLIGLVPMWLLYRASRWNYDRRIQALENAARNAAMTPVPAPPPPVAEPEPANEPLPDEPLTEEPRTEEPPTDYPPVDEHKPSP